MALDIGNLVAIAAAQLAVAVIVLASFRGRADLGTAPLHGALAALWSWSLALGALPVTPRLSIDPTSAVIVPATAVALLLMHLREGTHRSRELLLAIGIGSATATIAALLLSPEPLLSTAARGATRVILVFIDALVALSTYEVVGRVLPGLWVRVFAAVALATYVDVAVEVGFTRSWEDSFFDELVSGLLGATLGSLSFGAVTSAWLYRMEDRAWTWMRPDQPLMDVLPVLTSRQRFAPMRPETLRDATSGVYSRLFFDDALPVEIDRAQQYGRHTSVLLFESRDPACAADLGRALMDTLRMTDVPSRWSSTRFAAILPGADPRAAEASAGRVAALLDQRRAHLGMPRVALVVGVASYPTDGDRPAEIMGAAERRLAQRLGLTARG